MVYIAGADHLPLKFLPPRQLIGPRPPVPPIPTANFFTLGRMIMQSDFATTLAGTSLLATIACNTVAALLRVCSSSALSAPQTGRVEKIRNRDVSKQGIALWLCGMEFKPLSPVGIPAFQSTSKRLYSWPLRFVSDSWRVRLRNELVVTGYVL